MGPILGDQVLDVKISMVHLMDFCGKGDALFGLAWNILMICCRRFLNDFLVVFTPKLGELGSNLTSIFFFQMGW